MCSSCATMYQTEHTGSTSRPSGIPRSACTAQERPSSSLQQRAIWPAMSASLERPFLGKKDKNWRTNWERTCSWSAPLSPRKVSRKSLMKPFVRLSAPEGQSDRDPSFRLSFPYSGVDLLPNKWLFPFTASFISCLAINARTSSAQKRRRRTAMEMVL